MPDNGAKLSAVAVLAAGGTGARLGKAIPKQFLEVAGRPLLAHTWARLARCPLVEGVVLVLPKEGFERHCERMRPWVSEAKLVAQVPGGEERQDSVWNGLQALASFEGIVLVHDGARPLVSVAILEATVEAAQRHGAAIAALPVQETLKEVGAGDVIERTVDRRRLYRAQTPQAFRIEILRAAFAKAQAEGFRATDESALAENLGVPVHLVAGSERNIKVTTAEDFALAEHYLRLEADG
jgi:2-C-methyl-D-erythritol 4-phosphate cytidylyltransferase